jgi:hypothetical protein
MSLPQALEARPFYQSAYQRLEDAQYLLAARRTTGAVYLAGYTVECILKALTLSAVPRGRRAAVLKSFRGVKAHDFDWLKASYSRCGGTPPPAEIHREFAVVDRWTTVLRYQAGSVPMTPAKRFLGAVERILEWANGRL